MANHSALLVGRALITSCGLLVFMFQYLMGQLRIQAIEMHHMDPTDIVLVPYDIHRLEIYVTTVFMASVLILCTTTPPQPSSLLALVWHWMQATVAFWVTAIVCGTPPTREIYHTGLACAYVATLVILTTAASSGGTTYQQQNIAADQQFGPWWQSRMALPLLPAKKNSAIDPKLSFDAQLLAACQLHTTVFVTIPFQVLRLYDWGSQIQRWPLPIVLGSTYGFVLGSLIGCHGIWILRCSPRMTDWYQSWTSSASKRGAVVNGKHQD